MSASEDEIIAEFRRRKREQLKLSAPIFLKFLFPGVLLLQLSSQLGFKLIVIPGVALLAVGFFRGAKLLSNTPRCPVCDAVQFPRKGGSGFLTFPYRSCDDCGQRLSKGWRDS